MKIMNFETAKWRRDAIDGEAIDETTIIIQRRKRRRVIAIALAALAVILIAVFFFSRGEEAAGPPANAEGAEALPAVTVTVPGREQIARTVSATGSIAARRDMPVGVAGEGGMVVRVLVEPGQWVGAGQTLAVIERSVQSQEAQRLQANIEVARADARLAQQELERAQALVGRGFVSKADVERRTATRDAANARVRVAQAQLGETRARIGRLDIRSPAAGLVLDRNVEPGQVVSGGSGALFRIAMGGQMELLAQLPEADLTRISAGTPATVTPVGSTEAIQGQVWQIAPIVDPATRQGIARVAIPYSRSLRPGGFASASMVSGSTDAPLLPESAVLNDDRGSFVYIVGRDNVVQRRNVKVGSVIDRGVIITEGLSGNERVVMAAGAFLNPGEKIRPQRASAR
jgi:RND family efflux transporter MFP subunit